MSTPSTYMTSAHLDAYFRRVDADRRKLTGLRWALEDLAEYAGAEALDRAIDRALLRRAIDAELGFVPGTAVDQHLALLAIRERRRP